MASRSHRPNSSIAQIEPARWQIIELAGSQHGLISRPQLLASGLTPRVIQGWRKDLRILPAGRSVFAFGRRAEGFRAACMAAVMVVGEGAAVSGRSAAALWGFDNHRGDISVVNQRSRRPADFRLDSRGIAHARPVHVSRNRNLASDLIARKAGIPVLRPAWILLHLAGQLPPEALGRLFKEADRLGLLRESDLRRCAENGRGFVGIDIFRELLARRHPDSKAARTLLEVLFLEICAEHGIETPVVNQPRGRYYPDFRWEGIKLIVEVDGYEGHAGRLAFLDDAARENELRSQGYQVIRFTWEEVTQRPDLVARLVKQEIARCRTLARTRRS